MGMVLAYIICNYCIIEFIQYIIQSYSRLKWHFYNVYFVLKPIKEKFSKIRQTFKQEEQHVCEQVKVIGFRKYENELKQTGHDKKSFICGVNGII